MKVCCDRLNTSVTLATVGYIAAFTLLPVVNLAAASGDIVAN
ncbi:hypothetical protein [Nostoc sp.]